MTTKIILSLAIIGVVGVVAVGATTAYFTDTETSTGNVFTAGTLNLKVGENDPTTWNFNFGDIKPGDSDSAEAVLQNTGSINGYLHITFDNRVNDEMECVEPELNDQDNPDTTCGNPGTNFGELAENLDLLIYIDENPAGTYDQFDLGTDTLVYQGKLKGILQGDEFNYVLPHLPVAEFRDFRVEWSLDASVGNIVQSDKAGFDIIFELAQNQKDIVGDWHFNEATSTIAYDSSGRGNHGTLNGATWGDGIYNPALSFDGDDYIVVSDSDSLEPNIVTLESWVKSSVSPGNHRYIAGKSYGSGWGSYHLYTGNSGGLKFYIGHNGGYVASSNANAEDVWNDEWHHIAGTFDGNNVKLYLDGAEVGAGVATSETIDYNDEDFYIGSYKTGYCFNGLIDEVKVYKRALAPDEILAHYNAGI